LRAQLVEETTTQPRHIDWRKANPFFAMKILLTNRLSV
jgi:hypothetical protein